MFLNYFNPICTKMRGGEVFHPLWFLSIYIKTFLVCLLFFCLCPINVKTAELIGPKFCVGPYMASGKVSKIGLQ